MKRSPTAGITPILHGSLLAESVGLARFGFDGGFFATGLAEVAGDAAVARGGDWDQAGIARQHSRAVAAIIRDI
jgi:hypothetical protein